MSRRKKPIGSPFTPAEDAQLMRLVDQAFDLRETGYVIDAAEAIAEWFERGRPDRAARRTSAKAA